MSLAENLKNCTHSGTSVVPPIELPDLNGGLDDTPAGVTDRDALLKHLGREALHASVGRNFAASYYTTETGEKRPRMYRVGSPAFGKCQYVMLTNKQYASVLVVDIDRPGTQGGHPSNLAADVRITFHKLITSNVGPNWVGINPVSGKAQAIWLIDSVYADEGGKSRHMSLLAATSRTLGGLLDHDPHFAHRFSRSPFYEGKDATAYRWYCQHKRVYRLGDLIREVRAMTGTPQDEKSARQQFTSGRALITAVKTRREEAQAFKAIAGEVESEMGTDLDQFDPELIDGVRVLWITQGRAARDETAFRHALKTGHRLRAAGQRLTDATIIDAYEHAYKVAHQLGADGRADEMPAMRDRQTMARRVRGYVAQSKADTYGSGAPGRATSTERKALATMGRRGGKKAAKRWENDPTGEYATKERERLSAANKLRELRGDLLETKVKMAILDARTQQTPDPTTKELAADFGVSVSRIKQVRQALGLQAKRGRPKKG